MKMIRTVVVANCVADLDCFVYVTVLLQWTMVQVLIATGSWTNINTKPPEGNNGTNNYLLLK